jgi:polysaccharide biosynthesis/export protein
MVNKSVFVLQSGRRLLALVLMTAALPALAQNGQSPPQELVQYVAAARKSGTADSKIREDAIAAGWPVAAVDGALGAAGSAPRAQASNAPATNKPVAQAPSAPERAPGSSAAVGTVPPPADASEAKNRGVPEDYRIGAGDVLSVSVWKEPDASVPSVVVRPDGKITMPLIKDVEVVGLMPSEVERTITDKLAKLIPAADVTVIVTGIQSKKIYVIGAVKKEGPIPYIYRMSVLQGLTEAGGLNDYAKPKKIYILRNEGGKEYRLQFDYDAVIKGEKMEQNVELVPGDQIVVPH